MINEEPEVIKWGPVEEQRRDADGKPLPDRRSLPDRRVNPARLHVRGRTTLRRKSDRDMMEFINAT
jgi:hypothetical protein